jgi:hypothetical protein
MADPGLAREAERHLCAAGDWEKAVAMYKSWGGWEEAMRVSRAFGGPTAAHSVGYAYAAHTAATQNSLAAGARVLAQLGMVEAGIEGALRFFSELFWGGGRGGGASLPFCHITHTARSHSTPHFSHTHTYP